MFRRTLAFLLIFTMLFTMVGCKKNPENEAKKEVRTEKLLVEADLDPEKTKLNYQGLEIEINPAYVTEEVTASIYELEEIYFLDSEESIPLKTYDFRLDGLEEVEGVIILSIPLDLPAGHLPGAAYLNEKTNEWEPVSFSYDKGSGKVIIYTDHLSKYGVFTVDREGSRRARIEFLGLYGQGQDGNFAQAIEEFSIAGVPGSQCLEIGLDAASESLFINVDLFGGILQTVYGEEVLGTISNSLGNIGLFLSVVEVGNNIYHGRINEAVVGSLKISHSYIVGKAASALKSSVMTASMVAVAIIDYSLNKFGTTAIQGREDIYRDAYKLYYTRGEDGYKGSEYWYKTFYPYFADPEVTEDYLKERIDKIVRDHCNEFWTSDFVDFYVSEAREKFRWTGGEAGLNQGIRDRISQERRVDLYTNTLPGVFNHIALKLNMENERLLRNEYQKLSNYLNSRISFSLTDKRKTYANHQIRFAPLSEQAIVEDWTGKIREDGGVNTSFTLYGHMQAGSPNRLEIYEPNADLDRDEPIRVLDFKVSLPSIELDITEDIQEFDRLVSARDGRAYLNSLLGEDEYHSYYNNVFFPMALEYLLSVNSLPFKEDGKLIDSNLTGSYTAPNVSGESDIAGAWETAYRFNVESFSINIPLDENEELPLLDEDGNELDDKVLFLSGKGTYSLQVTVESSMHLIQDFPATAERSRVNTKKTKVLTFYSTGDLEIASDNRPISKSKEPIRHKHGVENLRTRKIIMTLTNPQITSNEVVRHQSTTSWKKDIADEVIDETYETRAELLEGVIWSMDGYKFEFKYPLE